MTKIYSRYAFTENGAKKYENNRAVYKKLQNKYSVFRHDYKINLVHGKDCDFDCYDVVIGRKPEHGRALYRVYKNTPNLTTAELALICDGGNLCFGYTTRENEICVWED